MEFGYFTLSDNHYENNPRDANQFISDITAEAIYADQLGMHSAWIGEHHFNSLGVLSSPELVLAYIAARTKHIRLAPAVNVTPLHHPIRVAEQWATLDLLSRRPRRFRLRPRLRQPRIRAVPCRFTDNQSIFEEGMEVLQKLWSAEGAHLPPRQALSVRGRADHAEADPEAVAGLYRLRSRSLRSSSPRGLGFGLIVAPFAAAMSYGGLKQVADLYNETCIKHGNKPAG